MNYQKNYNLSFSLVEVLIAITFIVVLSYLIYMGFINFMKFSSAVRIQLQALNLLENELEFIRNLKYEDVGIIGGYPRGKLEAKKIVEYGPYKFEVRTYVRNIDDPFDGTVTSTPKDIAPADYKLVELEADCLNCPMKIKTQKLTSIVAPKTLEATTKNGSLFIQVFDSLGKPVSLANVLVINNKINPPIRIEDLTNVNGLLQLIDIPTGTNAYEITVSKPGYSTDKTYPPNDPSNPNPINPHATVIEQGLTIVSFSIDKLSNLNIYTQDKFCKPVGNIDFKITGSKLIGTNPNIPKFSTTTSTDSNGYKFLSNLEWDEYIFEILKQGFILAGALQPLPFRLLPDKTETVNLIVNTSSPNYLLVQVLDENNEPLDFATVTLIGTNYNKSLITEVSEIFENNWINNYSEKTNNIELSFEDIRLKSYDGIYPTGTEEYLISKTIDLGTSIDSKILEIEWNADVPENTILKIQIAANNDNSTWNFVGPDGTSQSYFTISPSENLEFTTNKRFIRYKVYLTTYDENSTPKLKNIKFKYKNLCLSKNYVLFDNLQAGSYNLIVEKTGYASTTKQIDLLNEFYFITVKLNRE
jgi:hypothetical protein